MRKIFDFLKGFFAWIGETKTRTVAFTVLCVALFVFVVISCKSIKVDSAQLSGLEIIK